MIGGNNGSDFSDGSRISSNGRHSLPGEDVLDALATSWWTATIMRPNRSVEAVAGDILDVGADVRGYAATRWIHGVSGGAAQAIICADPWDCFQQGYRAFNGRLEWEDRFIDVILNCENKTYGWVWHPSASSYITVAQFHSDSWARASAATGLDDPYNLYHVGAAVAYWSISIEHPGASGGWPGCW